MDTEMVWDSDQEENLVAQVQQQQQQQNQLQTGDDTIQQQRHAVVSPSVPDSVLEVLDKIILFLLSPPTQPKNTAATEMSLFLTYV